MTGPSPTPTPDRGRPGEMAAAYELGYEADREAGFWAGVGFMLKIVALLLVIGFVASWVLR